ncbi:hypothetical protein DPMN_082589 [Dreissena polymorpha]|uniref:Uncharacterized protein n=1 Tax=Dreissena polymorpha TaxID=45954 RepID=A0A9D3Y792_DREPO|nr:hypothetical protein DPMN_082589 [Dreissena polymorpha]
MSVVLSVGPSTMWFPDDNSRTLGPRIMKLHRNIDHDSQMNPIDFEVIRYFDHDSQMTPIDFQVTRVSDAIHGAHSVLFSDPVMDNSVFAPSAGEAGNGTERCIISQPTHQLCNKSFIRVHRIGRNRSHPRSIGAKLSLVNDRENVRNSSRNLRETNYYVSEQFPKDVADRRRSLMPAFRKARADGKRFLSQL